LFGMALESLSIFERAPPQTMQRLSAEGDGVR